MWSEPIAAAGPVVEQPFPRRFLDNLGAVEVVREGGGTPLFFIADAGCDTVFIASLCTHAQIDASVYRVTDPAVELLRTTQGLAGFLLEAIRRVQPKGPYRIAGRTVAGFTVYELARQLVAADEEVAFLGLLEINAPGDESTLLLATDYEAEPSTLIMHWFGARDPAEQRTRHAWTNRLGPQHLRFVALSDGAEPLLSHRQEALGRALARTLRTAAGQRRPLLERSYLPLMTIQTGQRDALPYFCVHGAGASVLDFIPFAQAIGEAHPVHGFQARGMDGDLQPYSNVEHAAKVYLDKIESLYPRDGVHLVGHSFGGWIAFEIAQRLMAKGRPVRSLTLLDTRVPGADGCPRPEYTRPEALMALISLYEQAAAKSLELCQTDFEGLRSDAQLRLLHGQLVRVGLMPTRSVPEQLRGTLRCFEAALRTRYCPSAKFAGELRLVLVRGVGESPEAADERMLKTAAGWGAFATKLAYRCEAGNHITLLKYPHIASVAEWMRSVSLVSP